MIANNGMIAWDSVIANDDIIAHIDMITNNYMIENGGVLKLQMIMIELSIMIIDDYGTIVLLQLMTENNDIIAQNVYHCK